MTGGIDDFFQRSYLNSGNPLEYEIAKELSTNFGVAYQPSFLDLDEGKSRTGDLIARHTFPSIMILSSEKLVIAEIILVIECKSLPDHGWIFTESNTKQICPHFSLIRSQNDIIKNLIPTTPLTQLIGTTSAFETILDNDQRGQKKSNDQTSNVKDSSLKVIKLFRHLLNEDKTHAQNLYKSFNSMSKIVFMKFYQPVIIFKGHLFAKRLAEEKIRRTHMLQFHREYISNAYNEEATIHIVSSDHVRDYLQLIIPFYTRGVEYIVNHQDSILDAVRNDLLHWEDFNPFKIRL